MKKIVLTYGILAGIIVSAWLVIAMAIGIENIDGARGMFLGYTAMIVAFSFIFVAVKNYRDNQSTGIISFGKAFKIGLYISLIASTFYVATWLIEFHFFVPDFMEKYTANTLENLKASGASQAEIAETTRKMAEYSEMYKNPLFIVLLTYAEILPVGLLVSAITALIMKRKNPTLA